MGRSGRNASGCVRQWWGSGRVAHASCRRPSHGQVARSCFAQRARSGQGVGRDQGVRRDQGVGRDQGAGRDKGAGREPGAGSDQGAGREPGAGRDQVRGGRKGGKGGTGGQEDTAGASPVAGTLCLPRNTRVASMPCLGARVTSVGGCYEKKCSEQGTPCVHTQELTPYSTHKTYSLLHTCIFASLFSTRARSASLSDASSAASSSAAAAAVPAGIAPPLAPPPPPAPPMAVLAPARPQPWSMSSSRSCWFSLRVLKPPWTASPVRSDSLQGTCGGRVWKTLAACGRRWRCVEDVGGVRKTLADGGTGGV
eukprot:335751-Chlamydomonas_euryale.AAC.1